MVKKLKLPQNVIDYLEKRSTFNIFGLVNLELLKLSTNCKIPDKDLKRLIHEKYDNQMSNGRVEFIKPKKS